MELELQILNQMSDVVDLLWELNIYWASVSFGLMAVAHIAAPKLHTLIVTMITALYSAFSIYLSKAVLDNVALGQGYLKDLELLAASGELQSNAANYVVSSSLYFETHWTAEAALFGTFIGVVIFLWYSHLRSKFGNT